MKLLEILPKGSTYTGIDNEYFINEAKVNFDNPELRVNFIVSDMYTFETNKKYDMAICQAGLRHMNKPMKALANMVASVKKNGLIICLEINREFENNGLYIDDINYDYLCSTFDFHNLWRKELECEGRDYAIGMRIPFYMQKLGLHDFDAAWKSILEAFEVEIVELLFLEIFKKIAWDLGTESLDKELQEIQREIFHKDSSEKVISDKIIKVRLKDNKNILIYNFRTIDVEKVDLKKINDNNPLKLVFKMAKKLLKIKITDKDIFEAKIKLAEELKSYDKVKNNEQIKALVDFLEYLFLIQNSEFEKKYQEYKKEVGGAFKMSIDETRRLHYKEIGRDEGRDEERKLTIIKQHNKGLPIEYIADINEFDVEYVRDVVKNNILKTNNKKLCPKNIH